jgi:hypothetical protein
MMQIQCSGAAARGKNLSKPHQCAMARGIAASFNPEIEMAGGARCGGQDFLLKNRSPPAAWRGRCIRIPLWQDRRLGPASTDVPTTTRQSWEIN